MKRQIEKRSKPVMRFFTPELYRRFNSTDDDVADEANQEWEAAVAKYNEHLHHIRERLTPPVQSLAGLCLHDAEVLATSQEIDPFASSPPKSDRATPWSAVAILPLSQDQRILELI